MNKMIEAMKWWKQYEKDCYGDDYIDPHSMGEEDMIMYNAGADEFIIMNMEACVENDWIFDDAPRDIRNCVVEYAEYVAYRSNDSTAMEDIHEYISRCDKLHTVEEILGIEFDERYGLRELKLLKRDWNAFYDNPEDYKDTTVVDMIKKWYGTIDRSEVESEDWTQEWCD